MALLAGIFFLSARCLLGPSASVIVAMTGALGTQVFSTASRALWAETWGIFLLGIALLLLLRPEIQGRSLPAVSIAAIMGALYWIRPTFSIAIVAVTIFIFIFRRDFFLRYAATGAVFLALFILYSLKNFGTVLPAYYQAERLTGEFFFTALAGNLISPSRGLFVFVPVLVLVAYFVIRYRRSLASVRLVVLSVLVIVAHILAVSCFPHWWVGHSFGPRLCTGLVPWFVLLAILGVDAWLRARTVASSWQTFASRVELSAGILLAICSIWINAQGATAIASWTWNSEPNDIDRNPQRLWDWHRPQFLAEYIPAPPPSTDSSANK
jgi:hypothetical protein